jgi:5-(carboxyamino)imidazole ribonucleotide mutase
MEPIVSIVMGSKSDWPTMEHTANILETLEIAFEAKVISAHRTPHFLTEYSQSVEERGLEVIIAGAGGAAALPGVIAANTILPVLGVPIQTSSLQGMDSLLSMVQMPAGIPVATLAIGKAGAINAGLFAAHILGTSHLEVREALETYRANQAKQVLELPPLKSSTTTVAQ